MDKRNNGIELMEDGSIRLNNGKLVTPCNEVYKLSIKENLVEILVSEIFHVKLDADDYFTYSLWNHCLEFGHMDINKGVVAMDTGYMHKSVPALIMHAEPGQKVGYRDKGRKTKFDLRKSNLYIKGKANAVVAGGLNI